MSAEQIFSLCNLAAMVGWILLIVTPRRHWVSSIVAGRVIPLLLSGVYLTLLAAHWGERNGGFGSLAGVVALFANHWLLLAGRIHYLAFDLFIGSWEVRDAEDRKISHWPVIPCLGEGALRSYFWMEGDRNQAWWRAVTDRCLWI
jgi:hypothetical protein